MNLVDALGLAVPASFFAGLALESLAPAQPQPPIRGWRWLGTAGFMLMAVIATVPAAMIAPYSAQLSLLPFAPLGMVPSALLAYLVYSLLSYAFHRASHNVPWMWRTFHQLHHSPPRLDLAGAAFFHPLDMLVYAVLTAVTTALCGLDSGGAALLGLIAACFGFVQHLNVRTPWALGVVFQRPEAHSLHHETGVHAYNYSDLPLWDILFGTFRNPREFQTRGYGFTGERWRQWGKMLRFVDVERAG